MGKRDKTVTCQMARGTKEVVNEALLMTLHMTLKLNFERKYKVDYVFNKGFSDYGILRNT